MLPCTTFVPQARSVLLRSAQLRALEQRYRQLPLMQRAGAAAATLALQLSTGDGPVWLFAGPGNNGGDALATACELHHAGRRVAVIMAAPEDTLPPDARAQLQRWRARGATLHADIPDGTPALIIDGVFGLGLRRAPQASYAEWITRINAARANGTPVLALDLPSGLDGDTGFAFAPTVHASHTLSFIADKPGLHTLDGPDTCGTMRIAALGVPEGDADQPLATEDATAAKAETNPPRGTTNIDAPPLCSGATLALPDIAAALRPRPANSHKGSNGSLAVIGGAPGMSGAALLAARAALHLGAGRVFVGLNDATAPHLDPAQAELMLRTPSDALDQANAIVIGPGLGQSPAALALLRRATKSDSPLLLDADALTLLGAHPVLVRTLTTRTAACLLTPHPAEAARLLGVSVADIQRDRIVSALRLARRYHACVALKGVGTILARPDGRWRINRTGNPGLASGGTGDVLAGMAGALLAQGWAAWPALCAAVLIHGAAADLCVAEGHGPIGLTASELMLPARQLLNALIAQRAP